MTYAIIINDMAKNGYKNIMILCKYDKIKSQPSPNRVITLDYLRSHSNIKVIQDNRIPLRDTLKRLGIQNWYPDIIFYYYCLTQEPQWSDITIPDFKDDFRVPKVLIFEDSYYLSKIKHMVHAYNFGHLIVMYKKHLHLCNNFVNTYYWGHYVRKGDFVFPEKTEKKYDVLFYGYISPTVYSLRHKIFKVLRNLQTRNPNLRIKIIPHPGYHNKEEIKKTPMQKQLFQLILSRFTITTSSKHNVLLKKYYEKYHYRVRS